MSVCVCVCVCVCECVVGEGQPYVRGGMYELLYVKMSVLVF